MVSVIRHTPGATCVVITVGCLIKGETLHFEYISEAVAQGLMKLNLEDYSPEAHPLRDPLRVPVIYGVLECLTEAQALARAGLVPGSHNHGTEWAQGALRMAALRAETAAAPGTVAAYRAARAAGGSAH